MGGTTGLNVLEKGGGSLVTTGIRTRDCPVCSLVTTHKYKTYCKITPICAASLTIYTAALENVFLYMLFPALPYYTRRTSD